MGLNFNRQGGFTLIEVLVALLILAVMAGMSWKGIDSIVRARDVSQARLEQQLRLQSAVAQWEADLNEMQETGVVPAIVFDGSTVRLTRRSPQGVQMVAWSLRGNSLTRWSAPPVTRTNELQQAWMQSQQLLGNEPGQLRVLTGVTGWQLYYYRGNAWTNAQSSGDPASTQTQRQQLPTGVRLLMTFGEGSSLTGTLLRDLRLAPQPSS